MTKHRPLRFLAFLGILALAACDDGTPTEPIMVDLLTFDETIELQVLANTTTIDVALDLADASNNVATRRGHVRTQDGRDFQARARVRFTTAQDALTRGDHRQALDEAREARRLIARAIEATGGGRAVSAMVERLEAMSFTIPEDVDSFDDPAAVAKEVGVLAADARAALSRGDTTGAGQRAVRGEQRVRHRRGHNGRPGDVGPDRAELAIELGATAVALATRLLDENGSDEEQLRFLATAQELLEKARAAYAAGEYARAVHFAELASWAALKAVVLPGGITEEEMRAMVDLATSLLEQARAAIGDDPTELQVAMFERAARLIELGETKVAEGNQRGVGALWKGAVISSWLIG